MRGRREYIPVGLEPPSLAATPRITFPLPAAAFTIVSKSASPPLPTAFTIVNRAELAKVRKLAYSAADHPIPPRYCPMSKLVPVLLIACITSLAACVRFDSRRGVEVSWQPHALAGLKRGQTTRGEVLDLLGPPSQVIALEDETVLYYLFERGRGEGLLLMLYNSVDITTHYDRAIFFFDDKDHLRDYAVQVHDGED